MTAWTEPHPEISYLPKPAPRTEDTVVEHPPVNPNASPEARALLRYLYSISGKRTLTGQHNFPGHASYSTNLVMEQTGKIPALYGTDWGFAAPGDKDSAFVRQEIVDEMIRRWQDGAVITLCWHAVRPTEDEPVTFQDSVQGHITDEQFADLLTPGTDLYERWCGQVDAVAAYFKQLQDARVPVLWRPYHEINGDWFWWNGYRGGGKHGGSAQLYRQIYDRLVHVHALNNLLWVWNPDRPARVDRQFVDHFPGTEYVDVLALDCYGAYSQSYYDDLNALSEGKVMGIGETYNPPTLDIYPSQPRWAFYMNWAVDPPRAGGPGHAERPELRALVSDSRMLNLDDNEYRAAIDAVRAV